MEGRNQFLESDGLYFESDTHEWFHDKISTRHAREKSVLWGSGEQEQKARRAKRELEDAQRKLAEAQAQLKRLQKNN